MITIPLLLYIRTEEGIKHSHMDLVPAKDKLFEWTGMYEGQELVSIKLKRGRARVVQSDVIIDHKTMRLARITLKENETDIADIINWHLQKQRSEIPTLR